MGKGTGAITFWAWAVILSPLIFGGLALYFHSQAVSARKDAEYYQQLYEAQVQSQSTAPVITTPTTHCTTQYVGTQAQTNCN